MLISHLQLIQSAIARMAEASAAIKRHAVVVTIAVLGSAQWLSKAELLVAGLFVTLVLAFLDASYLREERGFRSLYDRVRLEADGRAVDFSMKPLTSSHSFQSVIFSWSIAGLYLALLVLQLTALCRLLIAE